MSELNPRKVIDDHYDSIILKINNEINDQLDDFTNDDLIPYLSESFNDSEDHEDKSENEDDSESDYDFDLVDEDDDAVKADIEDEDSDNNEPEAINDKENEANTTNLIAIKKEEEELYPYIFPIFNMDQKRVYESLYNDEKDQPIVKFKRGSTRIRDYLNRVRSKAIKEANLARKENLASYELNKDKHRFNRETSIEEMRRVLFKDKFCFLVQINYFNTESAINLSNIYTILTDFYLDQNEIKLLKKLIEGYNSCDAEYGTKFNIALNMDKGFILHLMKEYISQKCHWSYCGNEIMRITKKTLEIEQVEYIYSNIGAFNLSADLYPTFDLSYIKSLCIDCPSERLLNGQNCLGEIKNLSALRNLEELKIVNMTINRDSFVGLDHLIKLELIKCKMDKLDSKILRPLKNLQILCLSLVSYPVYLTNLPLLKFLSVEYVDYLTNLNTEYYINGFSTADSFKRRADIFFNRINLPNLTQLSLKSNDLKFLKEEWFSRFESLKELSLANNSLKDLDFAHFKCFEKLEILDVSSNCLSAVKHDSFLKIKSLKALNLSNNSIEYFYDGCFQPLENLETLFLENVNGLKFKHILDRFFTGLTNLKLLNFRGNSLRTFDPSTFSCMSKLNCLLMDGNDFENLDKDLFKNIKNFKL